jgi:hypothetical protein
MEESERSKGRLSKVLSSTTVKPIVLSDRASVLTGGNRFFGSDIM